jgi:hypothetical protein
MDQYDQKIINPYGDDKDFAACGIFAMMNTSGGRFGGRLDPDRFRRCDNAIDDLSRGTRPPVLDDGRRRERAAPRRG